MLGGESLLIFLAFDVGFFLSEISMLFLFSVLWGPHISLYPSIYTHEAKEECSFKDV